MNKDLAVDGVAEAPLIFVMAGEASGDVLGAGLIRSLRTLTGGHVRVAGIGGDRMAAEGLESRFPISEMAVMGIFEILPRAPRLLWRVRQTADAAWDMNPAAVVSIDSKAFTMRVQKRLFSRRAGNGGDGPRLIHWVPPTVWAWRPGRAKVIARFLDHLLTLFPFEPPYFQAHGLDSTFVGHPAATQPAGDGAAFRGRFRLPKDAPVLGVLPGSRPAEIRHLLPAFAETVRRLGGRYPGLRVVIPTVRLVAPAIREAVASWRVPVTVVEDPRYKYDAFAACNVALAASGTVTLELTVAGVPTVVAYRGNRITAAVLRRLVDPSAVVLTNKLLGRQVLPLYLQEDCTPQQLVVAVERLFDDPRARADQMAAADRVRELLTADGEDPSMRAARTVLEVAGVDVAAAARP